jgi:hypothetical protein
VSELIAQEVVFSFMEDVYFDRPVDAFRRRSVEQTYELPSPSANPSWQMLDWGYGSASYANAVSEDIGKLEQFKDLYNMKLREDARDLPALQTAVAAFQELYRLNEALERDLQWIENLALFPGFCELCSS